MAASAREDGPFAHCLTELVPKPMRCTARSDYPEGGRKTSLYRAYEAEEARSPRVARPHPDQKETPEKDSGKDEGVDVEQRAEGPAPETESAASLLSQAPVILEDMAGKLQTCADAPRELVETAREGGGQSSGSSGVMNMVPRASPEAGRHARAQQERRTPPGSAPAGGRAPGVGAPAR